MFLNDEIRIEEYHLVIGNLLRTLLNRYSISELNEFPSTVISDYLIRKKFNEFTIDALGTDSIRSDIQNALYRIGKKIISPVFIVIFISQILI